jgi:hypothetical protein
MYSKKVIQAQPLEYDDSVQGRSKPKGGRRVKSKLTYTFHNPNTEEEFIRHLSEVFAEVAVTKVQKAQEKQFRAEVEGILGETVIA